MPHVGMNNIINYEFHFEYIMIAKAYVHVQPTVDVHTIIVQTTSR